MNYIRGTCLIIHAKLLTNMSHLQRKLDALESDAKVWATNQKKEVLWRVNFEEFVRRLRHKVSLLCLANI